MIVGELLADISARLPGDTPDLDTQVLLAHLTGKPRTWLAAHPESPLSDPQLAAVEEAVSRLEAGEPLPYILGHWEFFSLDFEVTPDVLIPRPETELLVEQAIMWLQSQPVTAQSFLRAADVGTGSGCISVALAHHVPDLRVLATDLSLAALEVALTPEWRAEIAALSPEPPPATDRSEEVRLVVERLKTKGRVGLL